MSSKRQFYWKKNYKKNKNIAFFSCLRASIDYGNDSEEEVWKRQQRWLKKWDKWYRSTFPSPEVSEEEKKARDELTEQSKERREKQKEKDLDIRKGNIAAQMAEEEEAKPL